MMKRAFFSLFVMIVFTAAAVSARQLRTSPKALPVCHGTCSLTVSCFGTCFCYKGACVSQLPPQERPGKR